MTLFQEALARLALPPALVVPWADLLAGRVRLAEVVRRGNVVRIESPGQDFEVEQLLLAEGATPAAAEESPFLGKRELRRLAFDKGRILHPRQWYLGFRRVLRRLARQLAACPPHGLMSHPGDAERMFDKILCHELCSAAEVPVPAGLGPVRCYDELRERMRQAGRYRVFVKLAHGSSASGVVAYQTAGARELATTTVEMARADGELRLYNSRKLRRYEVHAEVRELIDTLGRERVHVEEWLPKAGQDECVFDLRVMVIGGTTRHVVVRLSQGPMTNLHLKNRRGDFAPLLRRMGEQTWAAARQTCERAASLFPRSLHVGVDLLLTPGYRRHAVLEVNAFGDLLPGVLCDGQDTYEAEIEECRRPLSESPAARSASGLH
ncbi:MAG: STM4014 family protein [Gemmataceae bacterium]|nr:STM4014 family protein [Gemmataceae bacterium]